MDVYVAPEVAAVADLYEGLLGTDAVQRTAVEQLRLQAERLADGHRRRHRGAFVELSNWYPRLAASPAEEIWSAALGDEDYLGTVARGHGYPDWTSVRPARPAPRFERCVDALLAGDRPAVAELLTTDPDLASARSHWGHRATLARGTSVQDRSAGRVRVQLGGPEPASDQEEDHEN